MMPNTTEQRAFVVNSFFCGCIKQVQKIIYNFFNFCDALSRNCVLFLLPKFEEPCFVLGNLKGGAERNKLRQSSTFAGSYSKK